MQQTTNSTRRVPSRPDPLRRVARRLLVASAISVSGTHVAGAQTAQTPSDAQPLAVVRVTSANLRARPSLEGTVLGRLVRGDTVRIVLERPDGWSRIQVRRTDAWIRTSFLSRPLSTIRPSPAAESLATPSPVAPPAASTPSAQDTASASPPSVAAIDSRNEEDPRLAGRRRRPAGSTSTIPASRDRSRVGVMAGVATGAWSAMDLTGPALRAYSRIPLTQSPFAMRADLEITRVSARDMENGYWRLTDVRALLGAELGLPVTDMLEVSVVGSLGVARQRHSFGFDGTDYDSPSRWRLGHDVGVGAKVSRMLIVELHFFSTDGAPMRLLAGIRL